jgi:preprotein translocase subunit SecG
MMTILIVVHVVICVLLVVTVLLQFGKGAEMGAVMGGGGASQAVFSSSAKGNFMTKLTTILAIGFMVNSICLTVLKSRAARQSVFDNEAPVAAPLNSDAQALENKGTTTTETADPAATAAPAMKENNNAKDVPAAQDPAATTAEPTAPVPATKKQ